MNPPLSSITEAAGLLGSGAMFARRVGLRPVEAIEGDAHVLAGFKRGGFSLYFGDAPIFHCDLEGRWQRAFVAGTHYLKGLDGTVRAVDRPREAGEMVLRRRTLGPVEATDLDAFVADQARTLRAVIDRGALVGLAPPAPSAPIALDDLATFLGAIAGWDAPAWVRQRAAYHRAYGDGPPPFLPPDCPNPVILRPPPGAVADHARGVAALLGRRLNQCRDIFLAGSGWIDRPPADVAPLLRGVAEVFPIVPDQARPRVLDGVLDAPRLETIHGWLDAVPNPPFPAAAWSECRRAHLGRVTLRLDARSFPDPGRTRSLIADLKNPGIAVGLALFLDAASVPDQAVELVGALPLGPGDLISLIATEDDPPATLLLADWKTRLTAALPPKGARVVVYNPDKQWV